MSLSQTDSSFVRELVYRRSAIVLDDSKQYLIESRLDTVVRESGLRDMTELVSLARMGRRESETLIVEAIATHETLFFRDVLPFDILRTQVLPAVIAARAAQRCLTIWSCACSSGQEPYSIAMTILEHFPQLLGWTIRIVATDFSNPILARAGQGIYRLPEVNRGLPAAYLVKYFERVGADWCVKPAVRNLVEFRHMNLLDPWSLSWTPDIVFLRNVLIYFDVATKKLILNRMRESIARDGALFLGGAETTLNLDEAWERMPVGGSAYYRVTP